MFQNIKDAFSHCEDCGKSLMWDNRWTHPMKPGKLLCTECNAKYADYNRELYFKDLDKAVTNVIDSFFDYEMKSIKDY